MLESSREEIHVPLSLSAADYADRPIVISVWDPEHRLGRRPRLALNRRNRIPGTIFRSFVINGKGRGRFYGWMPVQLEGMSLLGDPATANAQAKSEPQVRVRRLSLIELGLLVALRRTRAFLQIARLLFAGNFRGASFRFVRQCEALNAPAYADWVEAQALAEKGEASVDLAQWPRRPSVLVTIDDGSAKSMQQTRLSLSFQVWKNFRETSLSEIESVLRGPDINPDLLWMRLPAGMRLAQRALEQLVQPFAFSRDVVGVYSDEDRVGFSGRRFGPFFKPAWNEPLAASGWLPLDGFVVRLASLPKDIQVSKATTAEVALRLSGNCEGDIIHVPRVLLHRGPACRMPHAVGAAFQPRAKNPKVSVVIPTRDRADLLESCLGGLFERTDGANLDVIVIDNDSKDPAALTLLARYEHRGLIRRLLLPGAFNFSRACNIGVGAAEHDLVLLLNNDVEPLGPDWLADLAGELDDPKVGAAGSLLLFPDGFVQHGGVTLGAGTIARHSFHFLRPDDKREGLLRERREVSAVTAACLLTRRTLWREVGGMDEKLTVAFNDVDFCLKVRKAGFKIIWTPKPAMLHRESVSRGADDTPEKLQRFALEEHTMYEHWGAVLQSDPYHNPNLSLIAECAVLEAFPRDLAPRTSA